MAEKVLTPASASYDESAGVLILLADRHAAAWRVAGEVLLACEAAGVRPPDAVEVWHGWPMIRWHMGGFSAVAVECRPDGCRGRGAGAEWSLGTPADAASWVAGRVNGG